MIKPIEIFGPNPGQVVDFGTMSPAQIFNDGVLPRIQQLDQYVTAEPSQSLDFTPTEAPRAPVAEMFQQPQSGIFGATGSQASSAPAAFSPQGTTPQTSPPEEDYNSTPSLPAAGDPADFIFNSEARRDSRGNLQVYTPPSGDGGGAFEVAGITARYQPKEAAQLKSLIDSGDSAGAEAYAKDFYRQRAAPFTSLTENRGLQLQLADTVHHRGEGGLRKVLQRATGSDTKDYGTLIGELSSRPDALDAFHEARQGYEWDEVDRGRDSRKKFRKGLQNRFNSAYEASRQFSQS